MVKRMTRLILIATVFMLVSGPASAWHRCNGVFNPKVAKIYEDHNKLIAEMNKELSDTLRSPKTPDALRTIYIKANVDYQKIVEQATNAQVQLECAHRTK